MSNNENLIIYNGVLLKCETLDNKIEIPDGVTEIGRYAFQYCINLEAVKLPKGLYLISERAFFGCKKLEDIEIPESVVEIGESAFSHTYLKSLKLPDSVLKIEPWAFAYCDNLTTAELPNNLEVIDTSTFANCRSLKNINIPDSVRLINHEAFRNCDSLTSIEIPEGVKNIEANAFAYCTNLSQIKFSNKTQFSVQAFTGCNFNYIYLTKDKKNIYFTKELNEELEKSSYRIDYNMSNLHNLCSTNFRINFVQTQEWQEEGKINFIPPGYTLYAFPYSEIDKYFVNK